MAKCKIVFTLATAATSTGWHANVGGYEQAVAVARCETHNWDIQNPNTEKPCPIGRIEDATEQALVKIEAARGT